MEEIIRKARVADVPRIYELLKDFGEGGLMLPRSRSELYDVIRAFHVCYHPDRPDELVGACAVQVCWEDLGEIRSLAVAPHHQGTDVGRRLAAACEADARELGLHRLFVLTYIPGYFQKIGFKEISKTELPHKIWADCLKCVKFPECGEIAMDKRL